MTPGLLRQLAQFVSGGLTLVGAPPLASPSLEDYPQCDTEIRGLVARMWGPCDGRTVTEHQLGQGKVVWGQSLSKVLAAIRRTSSLRNCASIIR